MLDMLSETEACMLGCTAADALMTTNVKLLSDQREILDDPRGIRG